MPEIRFENVVYDYPGRRALDKVSCTIPHNSVTALVGPNGAGKTTLLRCLVGLETPLAGAVYIGDDAVASNERAAFRRIGYLHDSFGLYATLTVEQCLRHAAAMRGANAKQEVSWAGRAAELLDLTGRLQSKTASLSRGWRQRVGIAQALVHSPDVVVLDEPATGLDPEARMHLSALVRQLQAEAVTLVISSHILTELESYSTHMFTLAQGRLVNFSSVTNNIEAKVKVRVDLAGECTTWPARADLTVLSNNVAEFELVDNPETLAGALRDLILAGVPVAQFTVLRESLADRYQRLLTKNDKEGE